MTNVTSPRSVTVQEVLPASVRRIIQEFIEYESIHEMMRQVFATARRMGPDSRKRRFSIKWRFAYSETVSKIQVGIEYLRVGAVVRIKYIAMGVYRAVRVFARHAVIDRIRVPQECIEMRMVEAYGFRDVNYHHTFCDVFHPTAVVLAVTVQMDSIVPCDFWYYGWAVCELSKGLACSGGCGCSG